MCGSILAEYLGTGNDRDEKYYERYYLLEKTSPAPVTLNCLTTRLMFTLKYVFIVAQVVLLEPWETP